MLFVSLAFAEPFGPPPPPAEAVPVESAPAPADLAERMCETAPQRPDHREPAVLTTTGRVLGAAACVVGVFTGYGCGPAGAPSTRTTRRARPCGGEEAAGP